MAMRVTGMNSGLDTETIIQELVKAKKTNSLTGTIHIPQETARAPRGRQAPSIL